MSSAKSIRAALAAQNTCGRCGARAQGYGFIDGQRYCNPETTSGRRFTCYQAEQIERRGFATRAGRGETGLDPDRPTRMEMERDEYGRSLL